MICDCGGGTQTEMATNKRGTTGEKRHVVCLPNPAQSHVGAMLKLAKLLHHRGFYITFVNSEFNHRRLLKVRGPGFIDDPPRGFRFMAISDGTSQNDGNPPSIDEICNAVKHGMVTPFDHLIGDLMSGGDDDDEFPSEVSCIVSDGFMSFASKPAADKYGLPIIYLWTISACALMGVNQFGALLQKGLVPLKDDTFLTNGYLDTTVNWIPGIKEIKLRDLPSMVRTTDPNDALFNFSKEATEIANTGATASIIHTFEALEPDVLNAFPSIVSGHVYAIAPLHLLLHRIENHLNHIGFNLWREDTTCLEWLHTQKPNSVLYVNFGSVVNLTHEQLIEFAMGIADSEQPFLWIIRPDLVKGDGAILPKEFIEKTKGRGLVTEWCSQEEVLNHPCIGGFLTHCGWNSVIESLSAGVPMLCWPDLGDQQTNCKYICTEWEAGLEINSNVVRDELESLVRDLMIRDRGKQLKMNAIKWKKLIDDAISPNGSSSMNLDKLVNDILLC